MTTPEDRALEETLRALRPAPDPRFAAELDARAAAGFRRGDEAATSHLPRRRGARLAGWLRVSPRRLVLPAAATALAAIAVATVVVVNDEGGETVAEAPRTEATKQAAGAGHSEAAPDVYTRASGPVGPEEAEPSIQPFAAKVGPSKLSSNEAATGAASNYDAAGSYASGQRKRAVERSAQLVLGAEPSQVRAAADEVFGVVRRFDGVVLSSSISDGAEEAGASFELLIPSGKLGAAMASLSSIGEVRSRHESGQDITAPTVGTAERLADAQATVKSRLAQLAAADTEAEQLAAEAGLREARRRVAGLRASLDNLKRRANLSHVELTISSGEKGSVVPGAGNDSWGVDDALGDAGRILQVAAGIALVGLAVLAPFVLIGGLLWTARRGAVRRSRERALNH